MNFRKACEILNKPDLTLKELKKSDEYKVLLEHLGTDLHRALDSVEIIIEGNLERITYLGVNEIKLTVLFDILRKDHSGLEYATIVVKGDYLQNFVRQNLKTDTGIKLKAKFSSTLECALVPTLELINIERFNEEMLFPKYKCEKCDYSYHYFEAKHCCLCGAEVIEIKDPYKEK